VHQKTQVFGLAFLYELRLSSHKAASPIFLIYRRSEGVTLVLSLHKETKTQRIKLTRAAAFAFFAFATALLFLFAFD